MHAYLITGQDEQAKISYIEKAIKDAGLKPLYFEIKKIDDIRELIRFNRLKINHPTACILKNFDQATLQAQNAFLKNLEEPQPGLYYFLTANNLYQIPPTISSRCQIIPTGKEKSLTEKKSAENFFRSGIEERMNILKSITQRNDAIIFINNLLNYKYEQTKGNLKNRKYASEMAIILDCLTALHKNGNVQLHFIRMAINLEEL